MTTISIICDVGGTLLLTDELHRAAWRKRSAQGLATDANIGRADNGLTQGLDSLAIAETMGSGLTAPAHSRRRCVCQAKPCINNLPLKRPGSWRAALRGAVNPSKSR